MMNQDLFDLMCSHKVKLLIEGEFNAVDTTLWVDGVEIAGIIGAETIEDAIDELMEKARRE